MGALALTTADLRPFQGEPRVNFNRVGGLLGYTTEKGMRRLIARHRPELETYGEVLRQTDPKPQNQPFGGRPNITIYLNESQAVLVCMFARTPQGAEIRRQIINVFLAYRHGKLSATMPAKPPVKKNRAEPWELMEARVRQIEKMMGLQRKVDSPAYTRALAYAPTILFLDKADGSRKRQTRPRWWYDLEVRSAAIEHHRQMPIDVAVTVIRNYFGKERTPSRSSLARFWLQLDEVRAAS